MINISIKESNNNLNILGEYIHNKTEFFVFNEDACEIDIKILKHFSYDIDGMKPKLDLTFYNLGKEESKMTLIPGKIELTGIPSEFKAYESKESCIMNLNSHFVQRVMGVSIEPNPKTGENMSLERIARWYKFKKLYLEKWVEDYPQIML